MLTMDSSSIFGPAGNAEIDSKLRRMSADAESEIESKVVKEFFPSLLVA
jgi:hypothetical protein